MFGRLAKFLLVLSAMAPVGLVYAWVAFSDDNWQLSLILIAVSVLLAVACVVLLGQAGRQLERFPFKPESVEPADRENIAFMLLYLSPLFTDQFGDLNFVLLVPMLAVFALLTATGYKYHFNPLLGLARWHFYKVSSAEGVTYVLITKKQLRNSNQIKQVSQLTEYILIDLGA